MTMVVSLPEADDAGRAAFAVVAPSVAVELTIGNGADDESLEEGRPAEVETRPVDIGGLGKLYE